MKGSKVTCHWELDSWLLIMAFQYLKGEYKQEGERLFTRVDRWIGQGGMVLN